MSEIRPVELVLQVTRGANPESTVILVTGFRKEFERERFIGEVCTLLTPWTEKQTP